MGLSVRKRARERDVACRTKFVALLLPLVLSISIEAQQQIVTTNHHDQSNFGLYSAQVQQPQPQPQPHHASARHTQTTSPIGRTPRVGLAPQERPACQLQSLSGAHKRRHLASEGPQDIAATLVMPAANASTAAELEQQQQQQQWLAVPDVSSLNYRNRSGLLEQLEQQPAPKAAQRLKQRVDTSERLRQLRQLLVSNNYDAYLVTPNDEHGSEYVPDYDRRLRFISGFTGSSGYALVLLDRAVLFTDGRYALQADADLDCNWWLVVSDEPLADIHLWLRAQGARGLKVATDARLLSLQSFDYLEEHLKRLDQSEFALISQDLVDVVWDNHANEAASTSSTAAHNHNHSQQRQRERPSGKLVVQPLDFAGQLSWQEKLARLSQAMERLKARHYVISKLDDIAWLLNLRGSDIPMSPLFKAYALVSRHPASNLAGAAASPPQGTTASTAASLSSSNLGRPTSSAPLASVEQLLAAGNSAHESELLAAPTLQAPQVLQVPASQTIKLTLYVDLKKVTGEVREHLHLHDNGTSFVAAEGGQQRLQVELKDYDVFIMDFRDKFGAQQPPAGSSTALKLQQGKLLLDAMANVAIHVLAKNYDERLILLEPLLQRLKSAKSELEVAGMRLAHWRDSLAISMLLAQLEQDIGVLKRTERWSETSAARELEFYRSLMDFNRGQSFETISAYGSNGAIVHYRPPSLEELDEGASARFIGNKSTYLLDSGGQYLDGTTDITRTLHFGQPSEFQRETYTRVLMGAVDMMSLVFEQSARSAYRLNDLMARRHLMELGLDYAHGTGHGIGAYSMVHEAPALIEHYASTGAAANLKRPVRQGSKLTSGGGGGGGQPAVVASELLPLQANMFTSVEPGYYKPDDFGIRLENIVVSQRLQQTAEQAKSNSTWLRFEPISLVPFEPKLIKLELLSNKQKAWLNSYNLMVRLRMTQQINYYLAKIRQSSSERGQAQVQLASAASSSRLHQQLKLGGGGGGGGGERNASGELQPQSQPPLQTHDFANDKNNHLKLEPQRFQQLLEQAHRWIMAKTELIALDVPQQMLIAEREPQNCTRATREPLGGALQLVARMKETPARDQDEWSALGSDPGGQRLMLAYMSALPFADSEAARVAATLSSHQQAAANSSSSSSSSAASWSQKCSGIECDLWLLEALNSHQNSLNENQRRQQAASSQAAQSQSADLEGGNQQKGDSSSLLDLFQISAGHNSPAWLSMANVWPLLGLASLLSLQLAVMAYVCVGGGGGGSSGGNSLRGGRKRAGRSTSGAFEQRMSLASGSQSQSMTLASSRQRDSEARVSCASLGGEPLSVVVTGTSES